MIGRHLNEGLAQDWGLRPPLSTTWTGHRHAACMRCLLSEHGDCTLDLTRPAVVYQVTCVTGEHDYDPPCLLDIECRSIAGTYRTVTLDVYDNPRGRDLGKVLLQAFGHEQTFPVPRVVILDREGTPLLPYPLVHFI